MKRLFLTSSASFVAKRIAKDLQLTPKNNKLAFIKTASEAEKGDLQWLKDDRKGLLSAGFDVFDYTISEKTASQIKKDLNKADIIYFSGGNTLYLLQELQKSKCIPVIRNLIIKEEKVYMGTSAGSIIAGPDIYPVHYLENAAKAPDLKGYRGLDLVNFVIFPHWGSDHFKKLYLNHRMKHAYTEKNAIIILTDYQYVQVADDWYKIIDVK